MHLNFQDCKIYFHSTEYSFNPKLVEKLDFVVFNDTDKKSFLNLTFTSTRENSRISLSFTFNMKTGNSKDEYDGRVFETNVDTCKLGKGFPLANILVNFLVERFVKYSNYQLKCPQKKGNFYIHNFPAPDDTAVTFPNIFKILYGPWELIIVNRVKATAKSAAERLFKVKLRGSTVEN